jgi:hypothetical protein
MVNWICYPSGDEPDMWTKWHSAQDDAVKGKHATAMRFLTAGHWKEPHFKPLGGKAKGLSEICIHSEVQWRLIGYRSEKETFTVLVICNHKNRVYDPKDAFKTAAKRWKLMKDGLVGVSLNVHPS